jgi:hypothetical protein
MANQNTKIELNAVIVAVADNQPQILIDPHRTLPSGPFETGHRTLEQGLRAWAGLPLGYVEQLYTFADRDRASGGQRFVSIGYMALVRAASPPKDALWLPWYKHFPWEDHRHGVPPVMAKLILPALNKWKSAAPDAAAKRNRAQRIDIAFPKDARHWNEELVLQRYELLWEAGLVGEATGGRSVAPLPPLREGKGEGQDVEAPPPPAKTKDLLCLRQSKSKFSLPPPQGGRDTTLGTPLAHDHRRILATAMARLRAKIKYRPVVFELLPDKFTLLQLQSTVEALAGLRLHKQNFRRLVEAQGLVEETGAMTSGTSGRPAKLFAFRREVLQERAAAGTKLPRSA